jgi:hypothetical protein
VGLPKDGHKQAVLPNDRAPSGTYDHSRANILFAKSSFQAVQVVLVALQRFRLAELAAHKPLLLVEAQEEVVEAEVGEPQRKQTKPGP